MPRFAVCDGTGTACRAPTCTSFFIALHIGWGGMTPPLRGTISHGTLCGLRRYGHGMPCPYTHIISYCITYWIETGMGRDDPAPTGTISHATLCGLGRNGHGMPCPYMHIISYCIHIVGGRDDPAPTGHHITWHALRIATEWAWHAVPLHPSPPLHASYLMARMADGNSPYGHGMIVNTCRAVAGNFGSITKGRGSETRVQPH
jgi:hypothetical protein